MSVASVTPLEKFSLLTSSVAALVAIFFTVTSIGEFQLRLFLSGLGLVVSVITLWYGVEAAHHRFAWPKLVGIAVAVVSAVVVGITLPLARTPVAEVFATMDGVEITDFPPSIPRCAAKITGTAPDGKQVYLAHRDETGNDQRFYYNKARMRVGPHNAWDVTTNVGDDRSVNDKFNFFAFAVDVKDAEFLDGLRPIGQDAAAGTTLTSPYLPSSLQEATPKAWGIREENRGSC